MTANGYASFNVKASVSDNPIRWLIVGGALLIAAIAIGTTIMVGNFRERALDNSERELENTVLLLARHFDQQLEDFGAVQRRPDRSICAARTESTRPSISGARCRARDIHEMLQAKVERVVLCRRHQHIRCRGQC